MKNGSKEKAIRKTLGVPKDLRIGQFIMNATEGDDLFFMEDEELAGRLAIGGEQT